MIQDHAKEQEEAKLEANKPLKCNINSVTDELAHLYFCDLIRKLLMKKS